MVEASNKRRPIWALEALGLTIVEDHPPTVVVRTRGAVTEALEALGDGLGLAWPHLPNTSASALLTRVCWLAPGEWAVIGVAPEAIAKLVQSTAPAAIVHTSDMTDAWVRWRIAGNNALALLAKGTSLDLHPRTFRETSCARTLFAQVSALLMREASVGIDGFHLHAETSLSRHLRLWFEAATREFQETKKVER